MLTLNSEIDLVRVTDFRLHSKSRLMTNRAPRQIIDYEKIRSIRVKRENDIVLREENARVERIVSVKLLENFHKEASNWVMIRKES